MLLVIKVNTAANEDAGIFKRGDANTRAKAEQNQHVFV